MEGVAVTSEMKLEMVLQKYLKDIPMHDKQMILEMIFKAVVEFHDNDADFISNCINDDLVGLEMNYYISGDDVFDILFDLGFYNDDSEDNELRSIGIDFGDDDV